MSFSQDLSRIAAALARAEEVLRAFTPGQVASHRKAGGDPVTAADTAVNDLLLRTLPSEGEGWLSEETADDPRRLDRRRVWVVDPLDGTREFIEGVPEWCVSVALVEDGIPVAGGICNPATGETVLGAAGHGVTHNGAGVRVRDRAVLAGAEVLASRSEVRRGEWARQAGGGFAVRPVGSVAYKLGLVAAGRADATWTLVPKHEWDVAAGAALVLAAGGAVVTPDGEPLLLNRARPKLPGLLAASPALVEAIRTHLASAATEPPRAS